ncbi:hypothetical protein L0V05_05705 [Tabrizicola sp. J26]|uniref:hypothetical protein n=1 Tax=Alitabrizicola rongguiensis TaxID=2909234 RepID=UPI001F3D80BB|nr:hypothetical protein [Tabrizicola rongguiensis]MCF1708312.1 hypothetical protein [Tabrizicola rongguiensis]
MTKHLADRKRTNEGARLSRYLEIARQDGEEGSHPATKALHSREATRLAGQRIREFTEIERGRTV